MNQYDISEKTRKITDCGSLQFISHFTEKITYLNSIELALKGGVRWVQLRMKDATDEEFKQTAIEAKKICAHYHAVFVVDDRVALAKELEVDGVHLGKNDMDVTDARKLLGESFIIGGTANTFDDVKKLSEKGVDYVGCGPFRYTTTKKNLSPILGEEGYRRITAQMKAAGIKTPIVAIGGIKFDDLQTIIGTGVSGIAISGSILQADDPIKEMGKFVDGISSFQGH